MKTTSDSAAGRLRVAGKGAWIGPMPKRPQTDWEKAARALCRHNGHPENTMYEGRPMWMSYLAEAKAVLVAIGRFDEPDEPEGNA